MSKKRLIKEKGMNREQVIKAEKKSKNENRKERRAWEGK